MNKKMIISIGCIALIMITISTVISAQESSTAEIPELVGEEIIRYQYATKYICGNSSYDKDILAQNEYRTTINIFNPQDSNMIINEKVVQYHLEGDVPIIQPIGTNYTIVAGQVFKIGCTSIYNTTGSSNFSEGFVVINTEKPLDITVVYTAGNNSIDIETIDPKVIVLPDTYIY